MATSALAAVASLAYGILVARWFGASGRGHVVAFMYWPMLVTMVAMMGVPTATTYYAAHRSDDAGEIIGTGAAVTAATGTAWMVVIAASIPILVGDGPPEVVTAARLFATTIVLHAVVGSAHHPLRVLGRNTSWNAVRLLVAGTPLLALLPLVALSSRDLVSYAALMVVLRAVALVVTFRLVASVVRIRFGRRWVKPLLAYGVPTVLAGLPALLNFRIDQAFLLRLVSDADVGNYAAAVAWAQSVPVVTDVVVFMILPRVASLAGSRRLAEYDHLMRFSVLVMTVVVVPITLVSPWLVPLVFGEEFRLAGRLSLVMVPGAGLLALVAISEEMLRADHKLRGPLIAQVTGLVTTVVALFVVVPWAGVWGAAVVSAAAYLLVSTLLGFFLHGMGLPVGAPFLLPRRRQVVALRGLPGALLDDLRGRASRS